MIDAFVAQLLTTDTADRGVSGGHALVYVGTRGMTSAMGSVAFRCTCGADWQLEVAIDRADMARFPTFDAYRTEFQSRTVRELSAHASHATH